MQKEYKEAMQKVSLSDKDKERILANVKKAYESSSETVVSIQSRPRFSARQIGIVAASLVVLVAGAFVIRSQFLGGSQLGDTGDFTIIAEEEPEDWEELKSVKDIAKETDCKTYTLGHVSKSYRVRKVEVKKKQKHVRITYKSEKYKDKILLEYKEEENASEVTEQFAQSNELTKEKIGDKEVTMYGDKECDAMTWQQESCTFAVKMSKSCSTEKAAKLASVTKEKDDEKKDTKEEKDEEEKKISKSAIGWEGGERESSDKQRQDVLKKVFELYGFRVTIEDPAQKVAYKMVDDFESFSFGFPEVEELDGRRVVGYAGREGSPKGVLDDFSEAEMISVNGIFVQTYVNDDEEEIYTFIKQDISFTLLVGEITVEDKSRMLSGLISVIHISLESGETDEPEVDEAKPDETDETDTQGETSEENVEEYQEIAQNIQYAIADSSLKKLSTYIEFPLTIKGLNLSVASAKEFQSLDAATIFNSAWVDSVVAYDTGKIKADTKTFTMGSGSNYLVCKIKNNSVLITELCIEKPPEEPTPMPSEE